MAQLEFYRADLSSDSLFPVTAYVARYWAHHTPYTDWMREHGKGQGASWTCDVAAMAGGSGSNDNVDVEESDSGRQGTGLGSDGGQDGEVHAGKEPKKSGKGGRR